MLNSTSSDATQFEGPGTAARRTPLHCAVVAGHRGVVAVLLKHGADASTADARGRTPLREALDPLRPLVLASLVAAGARYRPQPPEDPAAALERWRQLQGEPGGDDADGSVCVWCGGGGLGGGGTKKPRAPASPRESLEDWLP